MSCECSTPKTQINTCSCPKVCQCEGDCKCGSCTEDKSKCVCPTASCACEGGCDCAHCKKTACSCHSEEKPSQSCSC